MLRNESGATERIPIGVELLDPSNFRYGKYYRGSHNGQAYSSLGFNTGASFTASGLIPYDSDYDFSLSGIAVAGNTTSWAVDENGIVRGNAVVSTTNAGIKAAVKSIEETYGYKIYYMAYTLSGNPPTNASVKRTA